MSICGFAFVSCARANLARVRCIDLSSLYVLLTSHSWLPCWSLILYLKYETKISRWMQKSEFNNYKNLIKSYKYGLNMWYFPFMDASTVTVIGTFGIKTRFSWANGFMFKPRWLESSRLWVILKNKREEKNKKREGNRRIGSKRENLLPSSLL